MGKIKNKFGEVFGYVRVSTKEQHEDRQLIALNEYGVDDTHIFIDKQSGKNFNRPAYKRLVRVIRKGDIIVIKSIDRLGRNYQDILEQWRMITQDIGCGIHVIDMPILNTTGDPTDLFNNFISDMILQLLSFIAQSERETTIKRQQEGIAAAKRRRKVKIGRPKQKMAFDMWEIFILWKTKEYKSADLWRYCHETWGMSNRSFYRRLNELNQRFGDLPVERLRDLVLDKEMLGGIEFDNERKEWGIEYYNPYVLHNPIKEAAALEAKKLRDAEKDPDQEEADLKAAILAKRQKEFRQHFGITPGEDYCVDPKYTNEEMPTELIRKKKSSPGAFSNVVNRHKKDSGIEQAILLNDTTPTIPDIDERIEPQKPMKTIVII